MNVLLAGSLVQRLRLGSGLVLFAFALTHFLNHGLGLIGLDVMEAAQGWRTAITGSLPGKAVLAVAALLHPALGLARLAARRTLRLPLWEWLQIGSGVAVPFLLLPHMVFAGMAPEDYGVSDRYGQVLSSLWPWLAWNQSVLLLLVWTHGCIGLHFWLRLAPWYGRAGPWLLALAVAIPMLALTGFVAAGREIAAISSDPAVIAQIRYGTRWLTDTDYAQLRATLATAQASYIGLLLLALLAVLACMVRSAAETKIRITYLDGPEIAVTPGPSLLEISRARGVPHTSICGGRARCSTCRVRVVRGLESLLPPSEAEARTLQRVGAPAGVRLACQIRPATDLTVLRIVTPEPAEVQSAAPAETAGTERVLTVLFLDVRGFTEMSQSKLPYDVVFVLNRLFAHFGAAIEAEGGWIDKYMGDGMMAVFGRETTPADGCRHALRAAQSIDYALDQANAEIATEVTKPLTIGIGIHTGPLVLGEIGHKGTSAVTVIGRTVNTASRLEALTKELGGQLICSAVTLKLAGVQIDGMDIRPVPVRGLDQPLDVLRLHQARQLVVPEGVALSTSSVIAV